MALVFVVYWTVAVSVSDVDRKEYVLPKEMICYGILGIIGWGIFLGYYKTDVIPYRISSEEYIRQVVKDEEILAKYIDVSKENSEWENTVVVYNNSEMLVAALPAGVGINTVMDYRNEAAQKSQYLLMSKQFEDYENIKIDRNVYGVLYEDDRMLLYGKMH